MHWKHCTPTSRCGQYVLRRLPIKQMDYQPSDMELVYRRGDWHSWQDEIKWLEQFGEHDRRLTPGETIAMVEDLRSLQQAGAPFTKDPDRAYQMAHRYRAENNQRYARQHEHEMEQARWQAK